MMAMQINSGMSGGYGITTLPSRPELSPEAKNKAQNGGVLAVHVQAEIVIHM